MKASRPSKIITNAAPPEDHGWLGVLRRQANNILTVLLVIAAIAMLIKWRMRTAEAAKMTVNAQLLSAQSRVEQVRDAIFTDFQGDPSADPPRKPRVPSEELKTLNLLLSEANSAISNVLNSSDADARMRAGAFIARGDLYWYLANLPPLPGSATQPSLQLGEPADIMLQKSSDAYQEVLKNSTYADQHDAIATAHMGLAAIAENKRDWTAARQEFDAVVNDSKAQKVLQTAAKAQIDQLPDLQKSQAYLASAEGTPAAKAQQDAALQSIDAFKATTQASTAPSTMPSTMPATMPIQKILRAATQPVAMPVKK
jgi:hypothetical protein